MKDYYFTYGSNHTTDEGFSLGNFYTKVPAESYGEARERMFLARGDKGAFQYLSAEEAGVERFRLMEAPLERVTL
ncbi:hypothetical protein NVP1170O_090 [Vibrio phage 1.170.O._10N.261.52.C3]|nr:hypothetical protein NVP1170O_090 [Vibrio phage 1.170.O._10N.261.52.C3]